MIKFKKKNLSGSSKNWIQRQSNDHLVKKAKDMGYRSRAVFKLEEIDNKYHLLKNSFNIIDLGSAPGSWSQYLAKKKNINIVSVDVLEMEKIKGVLFIRGDFLDERIKNKIQYFFNKGADLILSDIASNTTGAKNLDSFKTNTICLEVLNFSTQMLSSKGKVLCKFFNGELDKEIIKFAKNKYSSHKIIKPSSSRKESKEMYIFCQN